MNKIVNGVLIVILVVIPTTFGFLNMPTQMGLSIAGCSLALAFANLDKFARFKGAGFEAELKEAVDKAYAAVVELKDLGLALTTPIIDTMTVSDRMLQFIPLKYKLESATQIEKTLVKLGASAEEIDEVCGTLYSRVSADHYNHIAHALKEANPESSEFFLRYWELGFFGLGQGTYRKDDC